MRTEFPVQHNYYKHSSIFRTTCMKQVPKRIFKGKSMCTSNFLVCAHRTTCVRALLLGNIGFY